MILKENIFREYDIRGIFGKEFDLEDAKNIGKAYGSFLIQKTKKRNLKIVIGMDGRVSSPKVKDNFVKGLLSTGVKVFDIGLAPTPLVNFACHFGEFDASCAVTASHNPKEYNGFKFFAKEIGSIFGENIKEILEIIKNEQFISGKEQDISYQTYFPEYLKRIKKIFKKNLKKDFKTKKIVVDGGNGVAGPFISTLLTYLGFEVVELFCEIDGTFPNHPADPEKEENLKDLKTKVALEGADFGMAFDGDGDRISLVQRNLKTFGADKILILLAQDLLSRKKGAKIVYEQNITSFLKEKVESLGGKALICRTGHSFVESKMEENHALLGGEASGHIFIGEDYYGFDDALLTGVLLLKILLNAEERSFDALLPDFPELFILKKDFKISDEKKFKVLEKIKKDLSKKYKIIEIDGIRIEFDNFGFLVFRCSNTTPKISLKIETRSKKQMENIEKEFLGEFKKYF